MTMTVSVAPRLFVILAANAPVAVIVRRGPSAWAHLTLWETRTDTFTPGAWFRGRIYAEKCDLSPDGQLFVVAAHQGRRLGTSYTSSWTAVSRPPWLHALALWPMGTTYGGGGRFVGEGRLILRGVGKTHPRHPAHGLEVVNGNAAVHVSTNEVADADWSGRDHANRLVFAMNGRIRRRTGCDDVVLADFTTQHPNPQKPPQWATRPL